MPPEVEEESDEIVLVLPKNQSCDSKGESTRCAREGKRRSGSKSPHGGKRKDSKEDV